MPHGPPTLRSVTCSRGRSPGRSAGGRSSRPARGCRRRSPPGCAAGRAARALFERTSTIRGALPSSMRRRRSADADARHAQEPVEAPPLRPLDDDVEQERAPEEQRARRRRGSRGRKAARSIAPWKRTPSARALPAQSSVPPAVNSEEAGKRRARGARERRRDGGIPGDELREEKGREAVRFEEALGLAHAGVGRERHLAERLEDLLSVAPAEEEPDRVGRDRRDQRGGEEPSERQLAVRRERARHEERRDRGDRDAELLEEDVQEDEPDAVLEDEARELVHVSSRPSTRRDGRRDRRRGARGRAPRALRRRA